MSDIINDHEQPLTGNRKSSLSANLGAYREHPYRFVAFAIYVLQNVLFGTFVSSYTPVSNALVNAS